MPQLVSEESGAAVAVPAGETMVGRGSLLKIADKRVSRSHALLEWKSQSLRLCSKHANPCFHRSAGQDKFSPLRKDEWAELHHGDYISFLPGSVVFRVVWEGEKEGRREGEEGRGGEGAREDADEEQMEEDGKEEEEERNEGEARGSSSCQVAARGPPGTLQETAPSPPARSHSPPAGGGAGEPPVPAPKKEEMGGSAGRKRILPAWLTAVRTGPRQPAPETESDKPTTSKPAARKPAARKPTASKPEPAATKTATSKPAAKKKGTRDISEEEEEEEAPPPAKRPTRPAKPEVSPEGSSSRLSDGARAAEKGGEGGGGADSKLSPCPYGTACYRKNPAHFREYSHDFSRGDCGSMDSEGGSDDRPVCPYGAECYRRNPTHRREFRHSGPPVETSGGKRGSRRSARKTKPRVSALQGDSDDDGEPNTYDYTDSFIDDAEASSDGSTSYAGDSEDSDWGPASGSEDMRELVEDAKDFLKNKKMWKPA